MHTEALCILPDTDFRDKTWWLKNAVLGANSRVLVCRTGHWAAVSYFRTRHKHIPVGASRDFLALTDECLRLAAVLFQ